jgi:hypothetical protein
MATDMQWIRDAYLQAFLWLLAVARLMGLRKADIWDSSCITMSVVKEV